MTTTDPGVWYIKPYHVWMGVIMHSDREWQIAARALTILAADDPGLAVRLPPDFERLAREECRVWPLPAAAVDHAVARAAWLDAASEIDPNWHEVNYYHTDPGGLADAFAYAVTTKTKEWE